MKKYIILLFSIVLFLRSTLNYEKMLDVNIKVNETFCKVHKSIKILGYAERRFNHLIYEGHFDQAIKFLYEAEIIGDEYPFNVLLSSDNGKFIRLMPMSYILKRPIIIKRDNTIISGSE